MGQAGNKGKGNGNDMGRAGGKGNGKDLRKGGSDGKAKKPG